MWNPALDRFNRKARRNAAKLSGDMKKGWQNVEEDYRPTHAPLILGINRFKRLNRGNNKLIKQFKQEAYEWYNKGV
jgi:hypothetical protein